MQNEQKSLSKKTLSIIGKLIIIMASIILCVNLIAKINEENKNSILLGTHTSKSELTQTMDNFEWIKDVSSSIGTITITNGGKEVKMAGNGSNPGKNAIYLIPENHQEQTFSFSYSVDYGDSFISAGVLLKVKKDGNKLQGYMLSFNNSSKEWYTQAGSKLGAIWKFTYTLGANSNNTINKTLVKALDIPVTGSMTVKSTAEQIIIAGTNINETLNISEDDVVGDGFGFFSCHYSHNCDPDFSVTIVDILPHNLYVDPNGGTWKDSSTTSTIVGKFKDEVDIPIPTRPGYTFVGWTKTGESGTMSTLTEDAVYTFGEDEETDDTLTAQWIKIDVNKESDVATGDVVEGQEVTYTITATNSGTVDGTAIIKDSAPEGTTFIENSIKINGEATTYTEEDLQNGINIPVEKGTSSTISFIVKVNKLTNGDIIDNTAQLKDITVSEESEEKESNNVQLRYVEPIISQSKLVSTENEKEYVVNGEVVTYTINISNEGFLGKDVIIKDTIPEGTTFVDESIKINGVQCQKADGTKPTALDLENGVGLNIPAETMDNTLSFDVTINDLEDEDIIKNTALVDENITNEIDLRYVEPIITQTKEIETEYGKEYVVNGEKVKYTIIVKNDGGLDKDVILKDVVPTGTTLVEQSVKINDELAVDNDGKALNQENLKNGILVNIPKKVEVSGEYEASITTISFEVIVNDINDEDIIKNIATIDDEKTNEVSIKYIEPIISQRKEAITQYNKDYVVDGEKITYNIVVQNEGSLEKEVIIKDNIPEGTTFVAESIKANGEVCNNEAGKLLDEKDLSNGIKLEVPSKNESDVPGEIVLSFDVIVDDINDEDIIKNTAMVDENETNEIDLRYVEPIITQTKEIKTEFDKQYVVKDEKIKYTITIKNNGGLDKDVIVKDTIPEGTTLVEESIKINDQLAVDDDGKALSAEHLEKGISVNIPQKVEATSRSSDEDVLVVLIGDSKEGKSVGKNYNESITTISFEVIVKDIEDEDIIKNVAIVDGKETNEVSIKYAEPIISQKKESTTQYNKDYVAVGEQITYDIIVENDGSLEKNVNIKDVIPNGTTFVEDSITLNNEELKNKEGNAYTAKDLEEGIEILVPAKTDTNENLENSKEDKENTEEQKEPVQNEENQDKDYIPGKIVLSFKVRTDKLEKDTDSREITNVAIVDGKNTNEVKHIVLPFNLKIEKEIKKIDLNNQDKTIENNKMAKIEIAAKELKNATAKVTYSIVVTNTGKIEGTAIVEDIIPEGFEIDQSNPSYWNFTSDGTLETETGMIKPGEIKQLEVVLNWKNSEKNVGEKVNKVEILKTRNESNAIETTLKDNTSEATIIMAIRTGEINIATPIITISSLIILVAIGTITIALIRKNKKSEIDLSIF